jgi:hypothetical protein
VCQRLEPRGYVHSVAKEVPRAHHHVADVNPDAEIDALVGRDTCVRFGQRSLRIYGTLHGVNGTPELRKDTVASCVRYAAPVFPNDPVEDCAPFGQPLERADLVSAHEAAVAFDIRCEDCDEASADYRRV